MECRRRRRIELARGWRFACGCDRCAEEAKVVEAPSAAAAPTEESKTAAEEEEGKACKRRRKVEPPRSAQENP